jgi:hypothetical protein
MPLALLAREVIALDPSPGMLAVLREGLAEYGIGNVRIIEDRWPAPSPPTADVALISHVGYDIEQIGPFLDAMEAAAKRLCVAVLLAEAPATAAGPFWPLVHGEARALLPALPEFLVLLVARGRVFEVTLAGARPPVVYPDPETALRFLRQQLFVEPEGPKDRRLQAALAARATPEGIQVGTRPQPIAVVTWSPPGGA